MKYALFFLLLLGVANLKAQTKIDADLGYGINIRRIPKSLNPNFSEKFKSLGNYHVGLVWRTDRENRVNFGIGASFISYNFRSEKTIVTVPCCIGINATYYSAQFISIGPLTDVMLDNKGIFHLQAAARISYMLHGLNTYEHYFEGNGQKQESSTETQDSLHKYIPQLGAYLIGNLFASRKISMLLKVGYSASMTSMTGSNGYGGLKPAQLTFGIGLGYKYGKRG